MNQPKLNEIYLGDAIEVMKTWPDSFIQCCVTSPPYWGLRDYRVEGQIGLERTPEEYIVKIVKTFKEVHRVLRKDGTLWINLGDCYAGSGNRSNNNGSGKSTLKKDGRKETSRLRSNTKIKTKGMQLPALDHGRKPKDLIGIPWRVAFALQADGWYLRRDIIWDKKNPMPESAPDRPTGSHEYIFLMSKSQKYFYDAEAIKEPASLNTHARGNGLNPKAAMIDAGNHHGRPKQNASFSTAVKDVVTMRNKRSVWSVTTEPFKEAHFATFPPKLIAPCVLAGAPKGGIIFDPFMGAGTSALVAARYGRDFLGIELSESSVAMAKRRVVNELAQEKMF